MLDQLGLTPPLAWVHRQRVCVLTASERRQRRAAAGHLGAYAHPICPRASLNWASLELGRGSGLQLSMCAFAPAAAAAAGVVWSSGVAS
jgi:hypothetical protein